KYAHVVTGKPVNSGGLEGRDRATGFGVVTTIQAWADSKNEILAGKTYIVQGYGNVGQWAALFMKEKGAKLTAVQDHTGTIYNENGIDPADLLEYTKGNKGGVAGYPKAEAIDNSRFFGLQCDICIPAALGSQITAANAGDVKAK